VGQRSIIEKTALYLAEQAQAQSANGSVVAANESSTVNGAPFTAVGTVNFAAPTTALTTGKRFNVSGAISGLASAVDLTATVTLQRDGVNISNSIPAIVSAGHTTANVFASLSVIDTPPPGNHTYSINLIMASGTITVGVDQVNITFSERN
jgi:hypothetical protein